jgi:hypothetical protein
MIIPGLLPVFQSPYGGRPCDIPAAGYPEPPARRAHGRAS